MLYNSYVELQHYGFSGYVKGVELIDIFNSYKEERQVIKDKREHHDAVFISITHPQ